MIIEPKQITDLKAFPHDVTIIGAGPIGLATALRLEERGKRVMILDSGGLREEPALQNLSAADIANPDHHSPSEINIARRIGGTSHLWGGRCVPFDPVDFEPREGLPEWPISYGELQPYFEDACDFFSAGKPVFQDRIPGLAIKSRDFTFENLERWATRASSLEHHGCHLAASRDITIAQHVTVTGLRFDGGRLRSLDVCLGLDATRHDLPVSQAVLCAGGNESVRLMLTAQETHPQLFGGKNGALGRFYMGHVTGQIADITITNTLLEENIDFYIDPHGSYVRRRFVPDAALLKREGLMNVAFWPVVPKARDYRHRSGLLSAAFLALSVGPLGRRLVAELIRRSQVGDPPYHRIRHVANILRDPLGFAVLAPWFLWQRKVARPMIPGFFLRNRARRYGLEFHSEQSPNPDSRITLGQDKDALGLSRLRIDYRFVERDIRSVVKAHGLLDAWLRREELGRLDYRYQKAHLAEAVLEEACHGVHQIGTIRMAASVGMGVVDANAKAFGTDNLYVAGTAVLPTSGQANPTFMAALLALRLADHLAAQKCLE